MGLLHSRGKPFFVSWDDHESSERPANKAVARPTCTFDGWGSSPCSASLSAQSGVVVNLPVEYPRLGVDCQFPWDYECANEDAFSGNDCLSLDRCYHAPSVTSRSPCAMNSIIEERLTITEVARVCSRSPRAHAQHLAWAILIRPIPLISHTWLRRVMRKLLRPGTAATQVRYEDTKLVAPLRSESSLRLKNKYTQFANGLDD